MPLLGVSDVSAMSQVKLLFTEPIQTVTLTCLPLRVTKASWEEVLWR
jgi:hypothetical protein